MEKKAAQLVTVMFGLSGVIMPEEKKKEKPYQNQSCLMDFGLCCLQRKIWITVVLPPVNWTISFKTL